MSVLPAPRAYRAPILTMDAARPRAEAFAVAGETIVAVGSVDHVRDVTGVEPAPLDGVVLPGLIDAHLHMERGALKLLSYVREDASLDEVLGRMHETFDDEDWAGEEPPTLGERVEALRRFQPYLHEMGITSAVDPAATPEELAGYQEAVRQGVLTVRTVAMPYLEIGTAEIPDVDVVITRLAGVGASTRFGDDLLRLGPIKVYADGEALKGQALLERPWDESGYLGLSRLDEAEFDRLVQWCAANGWGVGTHAVGGAAIGMVTRAYARAGDAVRERGFQLIHAYLEPSPETIALAARIGVIASLQPSIIWHNGAGLRAALGARAERSNPVRSWLDAGATVAFGSDGPFFAFDPRHLMWQAVTRKVAGESEPLSLDEAISIEEALHAYTAGAAVAAFAEGRRGVIRVGAAADWALWESDPTAGEIDDLRALRVMRTDVAGRTVYARETSA